MFWNVGESDTSCQAHIIDVQYQAIPYTEV